MKRVLLFRLMATLLIAITIPLAAKGEYISYTASYNLTQYMATDTLGGVTYSIVNYGDLENGGEPGKPLLPIDYLKFSVPYNATNFSVTTTLGSSITYLIDHMMYPVQPPRMMNDTTPVVITPPDSAAYFSGQFYPAQKAWVVDEGFLAGENHVVTVAVMPFAYQHTSTQDKLRKYKKVTVRLNYVLSDSLAMYPIVRTDSALRVEGYQLTQSMVVNPDNVIGFAPEQSLMSSLHFNLNNPSLDSIDRTNYPYLIITTPELKHSLRRIVALKKQKGLNVKIATMNDVMTDPYAHCGDVVNPLNFANGDTVFTDSAGVLRQYLRNAYTYNNTKYVLLAGNGLPYRSIDVPILSGDTIINVVSDLYFSDLSGDWSKDPSYIEVYPLIDRHSELVVGRVLAETEEEISNFTDKLFRYELNPGKGDYGYLNRILFTTCHDLNDVSGSFNEDVLYAKGFFLSILRDSTNLIESEDLSYPSGTDVVNQINNNHYSFLCFMNHASPSGIITSGYSWDSKSGTNPTKKYLWAIDSIHIIENNQYYELDNHTGNGLNNITNKWYPCIGFSLGKATVAFERLPEFENVNYNIGRSFTVGKDYGGPAFIGNTQADPNFSSLHMLSKFSRAFANAYYCVGSAFNVARDEYPYSNYNCLSLNFLGDPEFQIWPSEYQKTHENPVTSIVRSDNSISITLSSSCRISYSDNLGNIAELPLSTYHPTISNISPNVSIMASKSDDVPFIIPLYLQNVTLGNSQYVIASDVIAGNAVDTYRTNGDVVIPVGVEYEIEASGKVTLEDGFKVDKGAFFAIYPACF